MRHWLFAFCAVARLIPAPACADPIVEIASRGETIRAVLLKPANPKGAVILFAGGNGRLDISTDGEIAKLRFNQLVRTRALYARAEAMPRWSRILRQASRRAQTASSISIAPAARLPRIPARWSSTRAASRRGRWS